ncbi:MAG: threonylcarbamoyl-AMP synthase, partial [Clostridiales bacterium]|nr:threonylcarbamoyl-AMP synthase [Clostridiales bacterium]
SSLWIFFLLLQLHFTMRQLIILDIYENTTYNVKSKLRGKREGVVRWMDNVEQNCESLIDESNIKKLVEQAVSVLRNGGVVLSPTDTVYGLICMPMFPQAIQKIFKMKQRPFNQNLPIIVADWRQVENELPLVWNDKARVLAQTFWPGALTLACGVFQNNVDWLKGRVEVAVRVPDYLFIQEIARKLGPLLMTSANRHGEKTPHTLKAAMDSLAIMPDLSIDGGVLSGAPSTLVNVNLSKPMIEREGVISKTEIERFLRNDK